MYPVVVFGCFVLLTSLTFGQQCKNLSPADIYILWDVSGSLTIGDVVSVGNFVADCVTRSTYEETAALLSYGIVSTAFTHMHDVDVITDTKKLLQDIDNNTIRRQEFTFTDLALDEINAKGYLSSAKYGNRAGVQKYLFVITDGRSQNMTKTIAAAERLRQKGIKIFSVGVGDVNQAELVGIAGRADNVFSIPRSEDVDRILQVFCPS